MPYRARFVPFDSPSDLHWPLDTILYKAPDGRLLDVEHDLEALADRSGAAWRELFDARAGARTYPDRSGVWGKREWVLPELEPRHVTTLGEGQTQLLPAPPALVRAFGLPRLHIKQCGHTHTGSFKDWGMTVLVSQVRQMRAHGVPIAAVGCASTGDTSAALAAYCAAADIPAIVFLPADKVSVAQLVQPIANGALVLSLDTDFDGCMRLIREVVDILPIYLANSMNSLRLEGQKTIAIEIAQQLGWEVPDWVVVPGGNLGNVYALWKGFRMMKDLGVTDHMPRLAVAQAARANPLAMAYKAGLAHYHPVVAQPTFASAIQIGDPVSIHRAVKALVETNGVAEDATELELMDAAAKADRAGLFTDPHTGVALAVLDKLVRAQVIGRDERVVVVSTAHGLKFTDSKVAYHTGQLAAQGIDGAFANPPARLAPEAGKIIDFLRTRLPA